MDENSLSHTRWKCQYHIVFIPKYRRKVLYGKVKADVREILRTLCRYRKVEIIEEAVCVDHVHLCLSIPPKMNLRVDNRQCGRGNDTEVHPRAGRRILQGKQDAEVASL